MMQISGHVRPGKTSKRVGAALLAALFLLIAYSGIAFAQDNPIPVQTYYIPVNDDVAFNSLNTVHTDANTPIMGTTSIAIGADGTWIYYDQWENGYDSIISNPLLYNSSSNPAGTQIWGNGKASDGCPPNVNGSTTTMSCTDASDKLNSGNVVVLRASISNPGGYRSSPTAPYFFDGGDKFAATEQVAVTRVYWGAGSCPTGGAGTCLAGSIEVYPTSGWGTEYRSPVGENSALTNATEYTALTIQAAENGTVVSIDHDNNTSTAALTCNLNEGQSCFVGRVRTNDTTTFTGNSVSQGARITTNGKPVQVDLLTGDQDASPYEYRTYALYPLNRWSNNYWTPVSGALPGLNQSTQIYRTGLVVYNPKTSGSITVRCDYVSANQSQTIAAQAIGTFEVPADSGANCYTTSSPTTDTFIIISTIDSEYIANNNDDGGTYDWQLSPVPRSLLDTQVLVGYAVGYNPNTSASNPANGSPIWVTSVANTTLFVDVDGDGCMDAFPNVAAAPWIYNVTRNTSNPCVHAAGLTLPALRSIRIFNTTPGTTLGQTGMQLFSANNSTWNVNPVGNTFGPGADIVAAWGESPTHSATGDPGFDAGTTLQPLRGFSVAKSYNIPGGGQVVTPGGDLTYTISVKNTGFGQIKQIVVTDTLPTAWVSFTPAVGAMKILRYNTSGVLVSTTNVPVASQNLLFGTTGLTVLAPSGGILSSPLLPKVRGVAGSQGEHLEIVFSVKVAANATQCGNSIINGALVRVDESKSDTATVYTPCVGQLTIVKKVVGPGGVSFPFNYTLGSTTAPFPLIPTSDNGTDKRDFANQPLATTLTVQESTPPAGWDFTSANCSSTQTGSSFTVNAGNRSVSGQLRDQEHVTCTFTNTIQTAKLEIRKALVPAGDSGIFFLGMDGPGGIYDYTTPTAGGNNHSTGSRTVGVGSYTFVETAGAGTNLANYTSSRACVNRSGGGSVAVTGGTNGQGGTLTLAKDADVICTITNYRNMLRINIDPSKSNAVGVTHTHGALVESSTDGGQTWTALNGATVNWTFTGAAAGSASCTTSGSGANAGKCSISFVSNSAGATNISATATATVGNTVGLTASTGTTGNGANAVKTWHDLRIRITPGTANNKVGDAHTFTIWVETSTNGSTWTGVNNAPVNWTLGALVTPSPAQPGSGSGNTDSDGKLTVTINSNIANVFTLNASTTYAVVTGQPLTRSTSGTSGPGGTGAATKNYVDARIKITPNATNAVGNPHTFTVKVEENPGTGWVNASGETVTTALVSGSVGSITGGTCSSPTNGSGECTVIVNSTSAGTTTVNASSNVSVGGLTVAVTTNGVGNNGGPGVKTWADLRIRITPSTATNKVGDAHTFTIWVETSTNGTAWTGVNNAPVNWTLGALVTPVPAQPASGSGNTDATGKLTVSINSNIANVFTLNASTTYAVVTGQSLTRSTSGTSGPGGSGPATKNYVDAKITITPNADNAIGYNHTFTVKVEKNPGTGWVAAANQTVTPLASGIGSILASPNGGTCQTGQTNSNGECTVIISSGSAGTTQVSASTTVSFNDGVSIAVTTNGTGGSSQPATKVWHDLRIRITPGTANNKVGDQHTFTIWVEQTVNGTAWSAVNGATVNWTLSALETPVPAQTMSGSGTTSGSGMLTVSINSNIANVFTLNASTNHALYTGQPLLRSTSGYAGVGGTGPATKNYVDARIKITPNATNAVGNPHTFTVKVEENPGTGWVNASGETVTTALVSGSVGSITGGTCSSPTNGSGECTVIVNSTSAGTTTVNASSNVSVGGLTVAVTTNGVGNNGGPGVKTWADLNIGITPGSADNAAGVEHTFTIQVRKFVGNSTPVAAPGATVNFTLTAASAATPANPQVSPTVLTSTGPNSWKGTGIADANGDLVVKITSAVANVFTLNASTDYEVVTGQSLKRDTDSATPAISSGPGGTGAASKTYVDLSIGITPGTATNPLNAPHTFTIQVRKYVGNSTPVSVGAGVTVNYTLTASSATNPVNPQVAPTVLTPAVAPLTWTGTGTTDVNGNVLVNINSTVANHFVLAAKVTHAVVTGQPLTRDTVANTPIVHGPNGTDEATKDYVEGSLIVKKTAQGYYKQPYTWTITKTVQPESVALFDGETGTLNWTIELTRTPAAKYDFGVRGTVTVSNPIGSSGPVNITSIQDLLNGTTNVGLTGCTGPAVPGLLAVGQQIVCQYNVPVANENAASFNRVVVQTSTGSQQGEATVDWNLADVTPIGFTASVTDTLKGSLPSDLSQYEYKYTTNVNCADFYNSDTVYVNGVASGGAQVNTARVTWTGKDGVTYDESTDSAPVTCYRPSVSKTATPSLELTYPWVITKSVDQTEVILTQPNTATITYKVTVEQKGDPAPSNWGVAGTITVVNPNPHANAVVTLSDNIFNGAAIDTPVTVTCPGSSPYTVANGAPLVCTYKTAVGNPAGKTLVNRAAIQQTLGAVSKTYTGTAPVNFASAVITHTNQNTVTVTDAMVSTQYPGLYDAIRKSGQLGSGDSFTYTVEACRADVYTQNGGVVEYDIDNVAKIDQDPSKQDDAHVDITCRPFGNLRVVPHIVKEYDQDYSWEVTKTVDPLVQNHFEGETGVITWTVTVTKTPLAPTQHRIYGSVTITNDGPGVVTLSNLKSKLSTNPSDFDLVTCVKNGTTPFSLGDPLSKDDILECTIPLTYLASAPSALNSNTITATTSSGVYTRTNTFSFDASDAQKYNDSVQFVDDLLGIDESISGGFKTTYPAVTYPNICSDDSWTFDENDTWDDLVRSGYITNTAELVFPQTFRVEQLQSDPHSASATAQVNCWRLAINKSAVPDLDVNVDWVITKTVQPASINLFNGQSGTFFYTVTVTKSAASDFQVAGVISVTNPSPLATSVNVADSLPSASNVQITCPGGGTLLAVPGTSTQQCAYTATYAAAPASGTVFTNTATATQQISATLSHVYTATAQFTVPSDDHWLDEIDVSDTNQEDSRHFTDSGKWNYEIPVTCGDLGENWKDAQNGKYTLDNTASIAQTEGSVRASVLATLNCYSLEAQSLCLADAPYVGWALTGPDAASKQITIEWLDASNNVITPNGTLASQPSSGQILWYGAGLDGDGNGNQWPGWTQVGGVWSFTPNAVNPVAHVRFSFNPSTVAELYYPPALPTCNPGPDTGIKLEKVTVGKDNSGVSHTGDNIEIGFQNPVSWKYTITNTSPYTMEITSLEDNKIGNISCPSTQLAPYATMVCTVSGEQYIANVIDYTNVATVTGQIVGSKLPPVKSSDPSSYVCKGNELYGLWYYEANDQPGYQPGEGGDFLFKDAVDANLVPVELRNLTLPIYLSQVGVPEVDGTKIIMSKDGHFQFSDLVVGSPTYTLRVGDDALTPFGYSGVVSSLVRNLKGEDCTSVTYEFGYHRDRRPVIGDLVWYDVNRNGIQDEWYDADNDGSVDTNNIPEVLDENGYVSIPFGQYEFLDLNNNGKADLEGELNRCGIRTVGPTLHLLDEQGNSLRTTIAGNTGYYRFRSIDNQDTPLVGDKTYGVRMVADDPLLLDGAKEIALTGKCKPLSTAPNAPSLEIIGWEPNAAAAAVTPAGQGEGELVCSTTSDTTLVRNLSNYVDGIALDYDYGIQCQPEVREVDDSSLGDLVWHDLNKDGIQDAGEPGLGNITVELYRVDTPSAAGTAPLATTTTNSNGAYAFTGLDAGTYYVQFIIPNGVLISPQDQGASDALDSDIDSTGRTPNIVLPVDFDDPTWDAGLYFAPTDDPDDPNGEPGGSMKFWLPIIGAGQ